MEMGPSLSWMEMGPPKVLPASLRKCVSDSRIMLTYTSICIGALNFLNFARRNKLKLVLGASRCTAGASRLSRCLPPGRERDAHIELTAREPHCGKARFRPTVRSAANFFAVAKATKGRQRTGAGEATILTIRCHKAKTNSVQEHRIMFFSSAGVGAWADAPCKSRTKSSVTKQLLGLSAPSNRACSVSPMKLTGLSKSQTKEPATACPSAVCPELLVALALFPLLPAGLDWQVLPELLA
eukprot:s4478_g1.t1